MPCRLSVRAGFADSSGPRELTAHLLGTVTVVLSCASPQ